MAEAAVTVAAPQRPPSGPRDRLPALPPSFTQMRQREDRVKGRMAVAGQGIEEPTAVLLLIL